MIAVYMITMAVVTYLIRMIPLTIFQKKITNRFVRSFLYYVPYACLMAMTFPSVFYATRSIYSAVLGMIAGIAIAFCGRSLVTVAITSCVVVFAAELFLI